ncbi:hypothetical protein BDZ89DRAFT_1208278 [Hymenopellis radicata]|nr:hypothetical protein BDZ89DRAFT_1054536 [Hymenopellis radicata]KAF9019303.1 hypothetical protein BDZ89DRAFT_1208278 [Hymenopellis radicata]
MHQNRARKGRKLHTFPPDSSLPGEGIHAVQVSRSVVLGFLQSKDKSLRAELSVQKRRSDLGFVVDDGGRRTLNCLIWHGHDRHSCLLPLITSNVASRQTLPLVSMATPCKLVSLEYANRLYTHLSLPNLLNLVALMWSRVSLDVPFLLRILTPDLDKLSCSTLVLPFANPCKPSAALEQQSSAGELHQDDNQLTANANRELQTRMWTN